MEEAEMPKDVEKELNGQARAQKYLDGDLPHPEHGYSGKTAPNGSLINAQKIEYEDKIAEDTSKKKVVKEFPFIKEGDQQSEFPSNTGRSDDLD